MGSNTKEEIMKIKCSYFSSQEKSDFHQIYYRFLEILDKFKGIVKH